MLVSKDNVPLSSGPLYRQIKAHGWVCCRIPTKDYKIGDQEVYINKDNVYFQSDVDDSEYQRELHKPICCFSCNFFSYTSTKKKNTTVIRRDEILAASCDESDVATSKVLGKLMAPILVILWLLLTPVKIMDWILKPKVGKDPDDTNAALHITSKRNNLMYTFQVPNEQVDMVAASIMEQGGDSKL